MHFASYVVLYWLNQYSSLTYFWGRALVWPSALKCWYIRMVVHRRKRKANHLSTGVHLGGCIPIWRKNMLSASLCNKVFLVRWDIWKWYILFLFGWTDWLLTCTITAQSAYATYSLKHDRGIPLCASRLIACADKRLPRASPMAKACTYQLLSGIE